MGRRGNNEGSVFKRKSDDRWCAIVTTGYSPDTGKPIRAYYYDTTRAGVVAKRDAALKDVKAGSYVKPKKQTVGEWLGTWLETYVAPSVRPKTWESYESIIRVHLRPAFDQIELRDLQTNQIQRLIKSKLDAGLSARTIELILVTLKSALKQAEREGLVTRNVADHIRKPKKEQKDIRVLSVDEMNALTKVAMEDRWGPIFVTMLGTGLRIGEVVALSWKNVSLAEDTLLVAQSSVSTTTASNTKRQTILQNPKTESGKRTIPLPENVVSVLKRWRIKQLREKLKLGKSYTNSGRVFTSTTGTPLEQRNVSRRLSQLASKANIPHVNPHALRHTYATRMLEAGVHPKVVQELMGHKDITLTLNTYSHVMPEIKQAAAQAINSTIPEGKQQKKGLFKPVAVKLLSK